MAPIKSSLARSAKQLLGFFNTADLGLRGATQNTKFKPGFSASGGTEIPSAVTGNGYKYHVFTSSSPFVVSGGGGNAEILIVAGGGGGGNVDDGVGGGGGAGGIIHYTSYPLTVNTYSITVGAKGTGAPAGSGQPTNGGDSQFDPTSIAKGGGYGGRSLRPSSKQAGNPGGSGGGGCGFDSSQAGGTALQPAQPLVSGAGGTNYGTAAHPTEAGPGGGGGAGGTSDPSGTPAGKAQGGESQPFPAFAGPILSPAIPSGNVPIIGPSGRFGAGGNGGGPGTGTGTPGGGGAGGAPGAGGDASGYGSGGGGGWGGSLAGGDGSQGIVVVRYTDS